MDEHELRLIDAYWRAANYLSVGQIYLLDNPLLREPLRPEHVKPRLLGHFGTTPGPEPDLGAHEPRDQGPRPRRDLRHRPRARRTRASSRTPTWREPTPSSIPLVSADERGPARAVQAVLLPRRDSEPRRAGDARLDPRGRRARLRAHARLRRSLRQPRPAGLLRRRRRRGRDRPARERAGTRTSSSTRRPTARSCRSST